jgi:ornithine cyclodeaminase
VRYFDATAIRTRLPWPRMLDALDAMLKHDVTAPLRTNHAIDVPAESTASLLLMAAWRSGRRLGVKIVTVYPGNARRNERSVGAIYALFDARNGAPIALFDGDELTVRRTAGASAYAAKRLARADAKHLVMVGSGRIACALVDAYCAIRPLERVSLWSRTPEHAHTAAIALAVATGIDVRAVRDLEPAVRTADVVSCATLSTQPVVHGAWLRSGTHVDLVGAFKASMRETDDAAITAADVVVVDQRAAALAEGGDLVHAIANGAFAADRIAADLTDLARGRHPGRTRREQVTLFKSVGFALEDLAAAEAVYDAPPDADESHGPD